MTVELQEGRRLRKWWWLIAILVVSVVVVAVMAARSSPCAAGPEANHPVVGCINPRALVVSEGTEAELLAVLESLDGRILHTLSDDYWYVRVPASSFEELDAAKALLEERGFEVQYSHTIQLNNDP